MAFPQPYWTGFKRDVRPQPQPLSLRGVTEKADVYSFGIILFELASRKLPYADVGQMQLPRVKAKGGKRTLMFGAAQGGLCVCVCGWGGWGVWLEGS